MSGLFDLAAYQEACEAQRKENELCLELFESSLVHDGLASKDARQHVDDVRLFLNEYLLREDESTLEMGCYLLDDFMDEFLVTQGTPKPDDIARISSSLVWFYGCMHGGHRIDDDAYEEVQATVEIQLPQWQAACLKGATKAPAAMQDIVSLNMLSQGEKARRQETIDDLMIALMHLMNQEDKEDPRASALERLEVAGLVARDASGEMTLTHRGTERARKVLASL